MSPRWAGAFGSGGFDLSGADRPEGELIEMQVPKGSVAFHGSEEEGEFVVSMKGVTERVVESIPVGTRTGVPDPNSPLLHRRPHSPEVDRVLSELMEREAEPRKNPITGLNNPPTTLGIHGEVGGELSEVQEKRRWAHISDNEGTEDLATELSNDEMYQDALQQYLRRIFP